MNNYTDEVASIKIGNVEKHFSLVYLIKIRRTTPVALHLHCISYNFFLKLI